MGVSRYNSEGYPDPTTYGALSKIENEMKAARAAPQFLTMKQGMNRWADSS